MNFISEFFQTFLNGLFSKTEDAYSIISVLLMILIMTIYEFIVYRIVNKKTLYNKSFNTLLLVLPLFIGAIVYALQMNIVLTLGTIGALAIIRFRTAIKDPVDMLYLLWSIFIGISCGCNLYKLCVLTSLLATIIITISYLIKSKILSTQYIVVINSDADTVNQDIVTSIEKVTKKYKLKSRNYSDSGLDYVFYVFTKESDKLHSSLQENSKIKRFSIIEYETEDAI